MKCFALITGASSGIGKEFAYQLAEKGYNLILIARRTELLEKISSRIKKNHKIEIEIITADLSKISDIDLLVCEITKFGNIHYLINNAGFGNLGQFEDVDWIKHQNMIIVHVMASTRLIHALLPQMKKNNNGVIINLASIAAFVPGGVYDATKGYLLNFSKGLKKSLKEYNIIVQALCPGFTYSGFHKTDEYRQSGIDLYAVIPKIAWMSSKQVVKISLKAVKKRKVVVVPGWRHKLSLLKLTRPGWICRPKTLSKTK